MKKHTTPSNLHCNECGQVFSRQFNLNIHKQRAHHVGGGRKRPADGEDELQL